MASGRTKKVSGFIGEAYIRRKFMATGDDQKPACQYGTLHHRNMDKTEREEVPNYGRDDRNTLAA
jgi:hypothetical protein